MLDSIYHMTLKKLKNHTQLRCTVGNVSGFRCVGVSDCRSSGCEFNPGRSHTFVEIDYELISTVILLPSADSSRVVVSYKGKYVHKVLVNLLVKLAQEKSVVRSTDCLDMTIAFDRGVKHQNKNN